MRRRRPPFPDEDFAGIDDSGDARARAHDAAGVRGRPADDDRAARGARAEEEAARMLERHGLVIVTRNYRIRGGEIDLVAADGATLVFVEVRLRMNERFGGAAASITGLKQARILRAARHFLLRHPDRPCRFDAVLVSSRGMEWLRDAFGAPD